MKIAIKIDNKMILHGAFVFWLIGEMLFEYTVISQAALLLFTGLSIVVMPKIRWPYILTGYALFVVWSIVNIAAGYAVNETVAKSMTQTVVFCLIFMYGFSCYNRYIGDIYEILTIYKWVVAVYAAACLLGGFYNILSGQRLSSFGINANTIAMLSGYALILTVYEMINRKNGEKPTGAILLILLFILTILFTGSRKGLIIPILGVYLLIALRSSKKLLVYTVAVAIASCILLWLLLNVPVLYRLVGYRVEPVLRYLQGLESQEASMETRMKFIELAWTESKKSPVFGHGLDCFRLSRYAYGTYSHCNYVELLYSVGWIGTGLYYFPLLISLGRIRNGLRVNREKTVLMVALLLPFILCEFMNVSYFRRVSLLIPFIVMLNLPLGAKQYAD